MRRVWFAGVAGVAMLSLGSVGCAHKPVISPDQVSRIEAAAGRAEASAAKAEAAAKSAADAAARAEAAASKAQGRFTKGLTK